MIKIDKNIPIPSMNPCDGLTEAFQKMEIGDSVVIPTFPGRTSAFILASRIGIRITTRKENENNIRVWRIE